MQIDRESKDILIYLSYPIEGLNCGVQIIQKGQFFVVTFFHLFLLSLSYRNESNGITQDFR